MFEILDLASKFKNDIELSHGTELTLRGTNIGLLFFEDSTRTRESFKAAANRLGATYQGLDSTDGTSVSKGESFYDTARNMAGYCDLLVIRTPWDGSQKAISERIEVPVVNAGDGANQHPTQTLLDLFSIRETQKRLDDLSITVIGDLKHGRTVHSLVQAMSGFGANFSFVSPKGLELPDEYKSFITDNGLSFSETADMEGAMRIADIVYMTRIQRERFGDPMDYEKAKGTYKITPTSLAGTKETMRIMHPLPRVDEITTDVDDDRRAYYFGQSKNGVYVRMAILYLLLRKWRLTK